MTNTPHPCSDLTTDTVTQLQQHRDAIDVIDRKIVTLLKERIGIVSKVGKLKRSHTALRSFIRSGREAEMIRHFYREFTATSFAPEAAASIWRHIIAASTHHEAPLMMAILQQPQRSETLYWSAREYFGSFIGSELFDEATSLFHSLETGHANIAILPTLCVDSPANTDWWVHLIGEGAPKLFACLPFIVQNGQPPLAYAAAYLRPEQTTDDRSCFAIAHSGSLSTETLRNTLPSLISVCERTYKHTAYLLLEVAYYATEENDILEKLPTNVKELVEHIHWLGSYATPIQQPSPMDALS